MYKTLIIIGLGGFLGSISRYLSQQFLQRFFETNWPIGTLIVNLLGSFIIGVIYALAESQSWMNPQWRMFLAVGFCGGFTTFSSFALDGIILARGSALYSLFLYIGMSVILGLAATLLGIALVRYLS